MSNIEIPSNILGYKFKNISILKKALSHPSYAKKGDNYQILEFYGDRILSMVIAQYLIENSKHNTEGDLSKHHSALVCGEMLTIIALEQKLDQYIQISKGEELCGGRHNPTNLEDIVESIIAAIYIDSGDLNIVKNIIINIWQKHFQSKNLPIENPKSELQEYLQANNLPLPEYKITNVEGPAHSPIFTMEISIKNETFTYKDSSKKKAQKKLAQMALDKMKNQQ